MLPGLSGRPALINMHDNWAQGAKREGYLISRLSAPLTESERLGPTLHIQETPDGHLQNSVSVIGFVLFSLPPLPPSPSSPQTSWSVFIFFVTPFLLEHAQERHSPLYRSQTHFYSSGYLYGNEVQRVSFYFIFLRLLITTARQRRNTSCVSR